MSLLSICQETANDLALATPTSIIGNGDETAKRLLAAAQLEGQALARRPENGWVTMIREFDFVTAALGPVAGTIADVGGVAVITIPVTAPVAAAGYWYAFGTGVANNATVQSVTPTTVTLNTAALQTGSGTFTFGQSDYPLPADFQRPIDNTMWDRSRFWSMRGPQSPQQWQLFKSSVIGRASIQRRFRFRNSKWQDGALAQQVFFSVDPCPTDNNSALVFEYVSNAWCQSVSGSPQSQWLADTDTGILDEYLMTLGLRWRMLRRLGLAYNEELDEYERQVSKAIAKDGGMAILDLAPPDRLTLIGPWNLPETNFGNVSGS